jgi:hypothetical protein
LDEDVAKDEDLDVGRTHYVEAGGIAGLENILAQFSENTMANIQASDTICSVLQLDVLPLRAMISAKPELQQKLWQFIQPRYLTFKPAFLKELSGYTYRHIKSFLADRSAIFALESGQTFQAKGGAVLWQGEVAVLKTAQQDSIKQELRKQRTQVEAQMSSGSGGQVSEIKHRADTAIQGLFTDIKRELKDDEILSPIRFIFNQEELLSDDEEPTYIVVSTVPAFLTMFTEETTYFWRHVSPPLD